MSAIDQKKGRIVLHTKQSVLLVLKFSGKDVVYVCCADKHRPVTGSPREMLAENQAYKRE